MKPYLLSLAVGLLAGVIYSLLGVRSPAPPIIALVGLLGILVGEQVPPLIRHLGQGSGPTSWFAHQVTPHVFGELPSGGGANAAPTASSLDTSTKETAWLIVGRPEFVDTCDRITALNRASLCATMISIVKVKLPHRWR
jgi:XapX domain-containing protein